MALGGCNFSLFLLWLGQNMKREISREELDVLTALKINPREVSEDLWFVDKLMHYLHAGYGYYELQLRSAQARLAELILVNEMYVGHVYQGKTVGTIVSAVLQVSANTQKEVQQVFSPNARKVNSVHAKERNGEIVFSPVPDRVIVLVRNKEGTFRGHLSAAEFVQRNVAQPKLLVA